MLAQPAFPASMTFVAVRRKTSPSKKKAGIKEGIIPNISSRYPLFPMALTDIKIRQARAASKPIKLADSNGLYIEVKPNGSKLWRYRYRIAGKENVFAIGEYPKVSLHAARLARDNARALVRKGTHPAQARRREIAQTVEEAREPLKPSLTNGSTRRRDSGRPATTLRYPA
jgi:Arm DNA-binding domain